MRLAIGNALFAPAYGPRLRIIDYCGWLAAYGCYYGLPGLRRPPAASRQFYRQRQRQPAPKPESPKARRCAGVGVGAGECMTDCHAACHMARWHVRCALLTRGRRQPLLTA
jgi:hypothetical protein